MASNFPDEVRSILSDTGNLPSDFLNFIVQWNVSNPVQGQPGTPFTLIGFKTNTSSVTTSGTTFGTGADLAATAISFTDAGSGTYMLSVRAPFWSSGVGSGVVLRLNLDGADKGQFASSVPTQVTGGTESFSADGVFQVAPGNHTINARLVSLSGATATIGAGGGGPANDTPLFVGLYRLT